MDLKQQQVDLHQTIDGAVSFYDRPACEKDRILVASYGIDGDKCFGLHAKSPVNAANWFAALAYEHVRNGEFMEVSGLDEHVFGAESGKLVPISLDEADTWFIDPARAILLFEVGDPGSNQKLEAACFSEGSGLDTLMTRWTSKSGRQRIISSLDGNNMFQAMNTVVGEEDGKETTNTTWCDIVKVVFHDGAWCTFNSLLNTHSKLVPAPD